MSKEKEKDMTKALLAAYAAKPGCGRKPADDAMLIILGLLSFVHRGVLAIM